MLFININIYWINQIVCKIQKQRKQREKNYLNGHFLRPSWGPFIGRGDFANLLKTIKSWYGKRYRTTKWRMVGSYVLSRSFLAWTQRVGHCFSIIPSASVKNALKGLQRVPLYRLPYPNSIFFRITLDREGDPCYNVCRTCFLAESRYNSKASPQPLNQVQI